MSLLQSAKHCILHKENYEQDRPGSYPIFYSLKKERKLREVQYVLKEHTEGAPTLDLEGQARVPGEEV